MSRWSIGSVFVALSVCGVAGCRTDDLYQAPAPRGPVTDLDTPDGVRVPDINMTDLKEVDLVEGVLKHRALYRRHLQLLHDFYKDHGFDTKRRWAAYELQDVDRIKPYKYMVEAEVPQESLRPVESVAVADQLYERGLQLMKEGGHGVPVFYREDKMVQALNTFQELIENHPTSDKIDDAAYYCGEIHKEYFKDQETIAVRWYERALKWDPKTQHPVRFQAAVCYDFRLHERKRALELYKAVLTDETGNTSNLDFATKRINELSKDPSLRNEKPTSVAKSDAAPAEALKPE